MSRKPSLAPVGGNHASQGDAERSRAPLKHDTAAQGPNAGPDKGPAEAEPIFTCGTPGHPWLEAGVAILGLEREIIFITDDLARWLAQSSPNLIGQRFDLVAVDRFPSSQPVIDQLWSAATPVAVQVLTAGDADAPQWYRLEAIRNAAGWCVRVSSTLPPLAGLAEAPWHLHLGTEQARRDMFVRLLRAEARLEDLEAHWPGVIFNQRADFSFQYISPRVEELTGVPPEVWQRDSERFWELVHEADVEDLRVKLGEMRTRREIGANTFRIRHARTGRIIYLLEHRHAVVSDRGMVLGYDGVWLDVTRQTIAEKRLSSAAWKETLATITMGLAHDFSNIMAGILSLSETLLAQTTESHPFHEGLGLIRKGCLQASQLTQRIANLHHGKTGERQYHDLNDVVTETVDLARKILPRRLRVQTDLSPDHLPVYLDVVEFRQVVLNLALNAADAMPHSGVLTLRTRRPATLPVFAFVQGVPPRLPCICLSVEDTGTGIPARHLPFIFDPFFTTKPADKGSGLGLYNATLFADRHRGAITVDSVEGKGSTFHVWLPQADFTESERTPASPAEHRRSLLLVGEPGPIFEAIAELLRVNGYYVMPANQLAQAREFLRTTETPFDGLFAIATPSDAELVRFLVEVSAEFRAMKTIVHVCGGSPDEFDTAALKRIDLVLSHALAEQDLLSQLQAILPSPRGA